jgi:membrane dipeptidase
MSDNRRSVFADGCGERDATGLSYLGIDLVGRLDELGVPIDVSHISEKGFWDIVNTTKRAIIVATHSCSKHVCNNARNLSDEQIQAIAERGGIVGVSMHPTMVSEKNPALTDYIQHVEHVLEITSADNVGIGTDFVDYVEDVFRWRIKSIDPNRSLYGGVLHSYPKDLETIEKVGNIFESLEKRGHDETTLRKLRGENVMRVFQTAFP